MYFWSVVGTGEMVGRKFEIKLHKMVLLYEHCLPFYQWVEIISQGAFHVDSFKVKAIWYPKIKQCCSFSKYRLIHKKSDPHSAVHSYVLRCSVFFVNQTL